jgi:hypothetical protein
MKVYFVIGLLVLSACLKEQPTTTDFNTVRPVIEQLNSNNYLDEAVNGSANRYAYFMQLRVDSTYTASDSVSIDIAGPLIGKDVTVTLGIDTMAFNAFNAANGDVYVLLPSSAYAWTRGNTAVLNAGHGTTACYLTFRTDRIDFNQPYVLPITITDAQGQTISGNYGTTIYTLIPGNQYMGLYQSVGSRVGGGRVYTIQDVKAVFDLSAFFVVQGTFPTALTGPAVFDPNQVVANAADQTIYLSIGEQMDLTVGVDNSVLVTNDYLYGFGKQTYAIVGSASTWDPVRHVFALRYGFTDPYSGDSSVVTEVMTRIR